MGNFECNHALMACCECGSGLVAWARVAAIVASAVFTWVLGDMMGSVAMGGISGAAVLE